MYLIDEGLHKMLESLLGDKATLVIEAALVETVQYVIKEEGGLLIGMGRLTQELLLWNGNKI